MLYEPFFDMNVLLTADAVEKFSWIAGGMIVFHALFAVYLIYRVIKIFNQSSLRLRAQRN